MKNLPAYQKFIILFGFVMLAMGISAVMATIPYRLGIFFAGESCDSFFNKYDGIGFDGKWLPELGNPYLAGWEYNNNEFVCHIRGRVAPVAIGLVLMFGVVVSIPALLFRDKELAA